MAGPSYGNDCNNHNSHIASDALLLLTVDEQLLLNDHFYTHWTCDDETLIEQNESSATYNRYLDIICTYVASYVSGSSYMAALSTMHS